MSAVDLLPCAVLHTDADGRILGMNAELRRLVGAAAPRPAVIDDLLPPASRMFLQTHVWPMLLREGEVREIYLHLRAADATRVPVMVNASADAGSPGYHWVLFVARERSQFEAELIKARNSAEASVRATAGQAHFARAVADLNRGALAFLDLSTRCKFSNERFTAMTGTTAVELADSPWELLINPTSRAAHRHAMEQALSGAAPGDTPGLMLTFGTAPWAVNYVTSRGADGIIDGCFLVEQF